MTTILEAALQYASAGIRVFPVRGKHPIVASWKEDASTNEDVVKALFANQPEGTGVAGIIPDWAVVLDIDGEDGLKAIADHGLDVPDTLVAKTKKGEHRWYKLSGEYVSRKVGVLPKVDILVNGYVVMPPSPPAYQWSGKFDPKKIKKAPEWITTITKQEDSKKAGVSVNDFFEGIDPGEQEVSLFRYACHLRGRPRTQKVEAKHLVRAMAMVCNKNASGKPWEPSEADKIVEQVWATYDATEQKEIEEEHKIHSLADLMSQSLPKTKHLVKDLLPAVGYSLLSAPPKVGKSLIGAYIAACVASGTKVWGREVDQCGVLYLDLEQEDAEAVDRWEKIIGSIGLSNVPSGLYTAFTWNRSDSGGLEKIGEFLRDHPHVRLVVVDTLADIWPEKEGGSGNAYNREQLIVSGITKLASKMECAVLVVHHDRKGQPGDKIISKAGGSYAITGKAKAYWSLDGSEDSDQAVLHTTGKNVPRDKIKLVLDRKSLLWELDHGQDQD